MNDVLSLRKRGLLVFFFLPGLAFASWASRTPEIRLAIDASVAQMGLVLFGLSVGAMSGILAAGRIVSRLGTKHSALLGMSLISLAMLCIMLAALTGIKSLAALGLGCFGLGMGIAEIAINLDGAAVEAIEQKPLMHTLHGAYSLGTLTGALIGFAMAALAVSPTVHLLGIGLICVALLAFHFHHIPTGTGLGSLQKGQGNWAVWRDKRILLIAFIAFAMALSEGVANDWLPILLVDVHNLSAAYSSLIFVGFTAAMTVGRLTGGAVLKRFARAHVMRASALLACLGIVLIISSASPWLLVVGVAFWGLGASLGFPLAISAAGEGDKPHAQVQAVAIVGYSAVLVAPPALGLVGESYGLDKAMWIVIVVIAAAFFCAKATASLASSKT